MNMCDMSHSYVWHDSYIRVTHTYHACKVSFKGIQSLIEMHTCETTYSYAWHASFICVTWLIHMRDMTHSYVWHDLFICVTCLIHTYKFATWLIHTRRVRSPLRAFKAFSTSPSTKIGGAGTMPPRISSHVTQVSGSCLIWNESCHIHRFSVDQDSQGRYCAA